MPFVRIDTNVALDAETRTTVMAAASRLINEVLGKPERYIMVLLRCEQDMLFGGSDGPTAIVELASIGLPDGTPEALSAGLAALGEAHLGVPRDRLYVGFRDAPRHLWGWNGGTFA